MKKGDEELRQTLQNDQQNICIFKFGLACDVYNSEAQSCALNETRTNNFHPLLTSH